MGGTIAGYASCEPEFREVVPPGVFTETLRVHGGFDPAVAADLTAAVEAGDITPVEFPPAR